MDNRDGGNAALGGVSAGDLFEAAPDALVIVDDSAVIVDANSAAAQLFGYGRAELPGLPFETLLVRPERDAHAADWMAYRQERHTRSLSRGRERHGLRKDGGEFTAEIVVAPLTTARSALTIAAVRDVSRPAAFEADHNRVRRERLLQTHLAHLARHDALTGLPNRALLHDRIASAIAAAEDSGRRLAVLFLDLDRFKHVNDSFGHGVGDWLLESVAGRLKACVQETDTVSRQGGDEFVILLSEVEGREEVADAAGKILTAVSGTHRFGNHVLHVSASVGVAVYPEDGTDSETLIKNADIAMFHAKDHGRDRVQFFSREMNARVVERQALEGGLRGALERGEFVLYYQPKIDLYNGSTIGAEALLRWRHPERGLIPPERFVPLAEDSGLIVPIGRWVLREACRQARAWQSAGLPPLPVAVNICAIELRNEGFLDAVRRTLLETALDPRLLELELTETVLMESGGATESVLRQLKAMGLGLAVDDFGTGYSSLSYLTQFPIDALKVDQSFVREIGTGGDGGSPIITAVISMARSLKHRVIAEGVETPEQLAFLRAQRCEEGQGFHFSRPLGADRFEELLKASANAR